MIAALTWLAALNLLGKIRDKPRVEKLFFRFEKTHHAKALGNRSRVNQEKGVSVRDGV
jgi:hypothetical protein